MARPSAMQVADAGSSHQLKLIYGPLEMTACGRCWASKSRAWLDREWLGVGSDIWLRRSAKCEAGRLAAPAPARRRWCCCFGGSSGAATSP